MKDLNGRVVLVTGAARGMGRLHALTFAREGARVVITDVDQKALSEVEGEMRRAGYDLHAYQQDVSNRDECFELAAKVEVEVGPVDVLINNAAVAAPATVLETSESTFRRTTEVNYLGQVWMIQAFVPTMVKRSSGHVVNMCSGAGKIALHYIGAYTATKFAMLGLTDTIRQELKGSGVDFSIVNPGFISTGMFEGSKPVLITRWQDPQKVADRTLQAVKKNKREIFVPHVIWLTGLGRGLGLPWLADLIMQVLGGGKAFKNMAKERGRPF
jgi:short-subunit dehydrogenase